MGESLGVRGTDHAHLVFDGTPVPVENRLGEEGRGLEVAFGGFLTPSRIAVGMTCVGLARRAQELAIEHARERVTFGKPLAARQAIAFSLAENAADIEAARQLVLPRRARVGGGLARLRRAVLDGEADRGRHAHARHRQGAAGRTAASASGRRARSSASTATRAPSASRRARTRSRRRSSRAPSSPGRVRDGLRGREGRRHHRQLARHRARAGRPARRRGRLRRHQLQAQRRPRRGGRRRGARRPAAQAIAVQADMEDPAEIERLFAEAREAYGKVDYFVANAAAAAFKPIERAQGPPPRPHVRDERPRLRPRRAAGRVAHGRRRPDRRPLELRQHPGVPDLRGAGRGEGGARGVRPLHGRGVRAARHQRQRRQRRHHRVGLARTTSTASRGCRRSTPCCRRSPSAGWARCRRSRTASGSCCTRPRSTSPARPWSSTAG